MSDKPATKPTEPTETETSSTAKDASTGRPPKKPYTSPEVKFLGTVAQLTGGTGGSIPDTLGGTQQGGSGPKPRH